MVPRDLDPTIAGEEATALDPGGASPIDIDLRLRALESREDLLRHQVDGWCAWPVLRLRVQSQLVLGAARGAGGRWSPWRFTLAAKDLPRLLRPGQARYLGKTYTSGLAERRGQRYSDIWFDDLFGFLGSGFKIEGVNNPEFLPRRRQALVKATLTSTALDLGAALLARMGESPEIRSAAALITKALEAEFGSGALPPHWAFGHLRAFHHAKRIYRWLLGRVDPEIVLVADPGEHSLVAAAKERRLPVAEIQHGLIDANHSGYSWTPYAAPYRTRMPIPDALFLYGDQACRDLEVNGFWGSALRGVGSPRMDRYRSLRLTNRLDLPCTIVVTTQGIETAGIIILLQRSIQLFRGTLPFRLIVKLHPVYDVDTLERYRRAFAEDAEVEVVSGAADVSTLELLTQAHLHASISSTCHFDALALGVPTVVLPFRTHEVVLPLVARGHARLVRDPGELAALIRGGLAPGLSDEVGNSYFQPGALANMKREIAELISISVATRPNGK